MTLADELRAMRLPVPAELDQMGDATRVVEWAHRCYCSRSELARRLERSGCLPPKTYVQLRRLVPALRSFVDEGKTLEVSAFDAGYADPFDLTRCCKRLIGETPSRLRGRDWRAMLGAGIRESAWV